jgi:hypothetical protein
MPAALLATASTVYEDYIVFVESFEKCIGHDHFNNQRFLNLSPKNAQPPSAWLLRKSARLLPKVFIRAGLRLQ